MTSSMAEYVDLIFKILEICSIIVGVGLALRQLGKTSAQADANSTKVKETLEQQSKTMSALQEDIKALNKVVTLVAVQNQRQDASEKRIDRLEQTIDELRRGNGWIGGPKGIDKEY
jgi:septal ring factor EnvC (AmiA/AmiB activator)